MIYYRDSIFACIVVLEGSEFMNRYRKNMKLGVDHEVKVLWFEETALTASDKTVPSSG